MGPLRQRGTCNSSSSCIWSQQFFWTKWQLGEMCLLAENGFCQLQLLPLNNGPKLHDRSITFTRHIHAHRLTTQQSARLLGQRSKRESKQVTMGNYGFSTIGRWTRLDSTLMRRGGVGLRINKTQGGPLLLHFWHLDTNFQREDQEKNIKGGEKCEII